MKLILTVILLAAIGSFAQTDEHAGVQTLLILPFENQSKAPGLEWISEAFPEVLSESMHSSQLYVVPRSDRTYAFDRMGIPATARLARGTLFRIAEQMDADYVVFGSFSYDGQTFSASAQLLNMSKLNLSPELREAGPLVNMVSVQRALSWDLLRELAPGTLPSKNEFVQTATPIRLDAFENYVRGLLASTRQEKIQRFRDAVKLNPSYTDAIFELGRAYFDNREYESAASWFARIPQSDSQATQAAFYLGLSSFYTGDFEKSETAFRFLVERFPLAEVNNNLGVVLGRRGKRAEIEFLQKAAAVDPNDADYHFNLAVAYAHFSDNANAIRQLKETLRLHPSDIEAKSLLDNLSAQPIPAGASALRQPVSASSKIPLQRVKRNYDETSYRQLAMEIDRAASMRLSKADPKDHAAYHVERARQFFAQGFITEATSAYQEAIVLDPTNASAHAGLAQVYEADGKEKEAAAEASAALQMEPSVTAFLVLARQNLKENKLSAASQNVEQALALDPRNRDAQELKQTLTEKLSGARN